jgi:hypothetical protein
MRLITKSEPTPVLTAYPSFEKYIFVSTPCCGHPAKGSLYCIAVKSHRYEKSLAGLLVGFSIYTVGMEIYISKSTFAPRYFVQK